MTDHLTTRDTGRYAGTWYDLPDGAKRYYTEEHIAHMNALHARHDDREQVAEAIDTVRANKGKGTINPFVKTAPAEPKPKPQKPSEKNCPICGRTFIPWRINTATCGLEDCAKKHRSKLKQQYWKRFTAKRKEQAA